MALFHNIVSVQALALVHALDKDLRGLVLDSLFAKDYYAAIKWARQCSVYDGDGPDLTRIIREWMVDRQIFVVRRLGFEVRPGSKRMMREFDDMPNVNKRWKVTFSEEVDLTTDPPSVSFSPKFEE
jgi:hypothetical protein